MGGGGGGVLTGREGRKKREVMRTTPDYNSNIFSERLLFLSQRFEG